MHKFVAADLVAVFVLRTQVITFKSTQRIDAGHVKFFIIRQVFSFKLFDVTGLAVQDTDYLPEQRIIPAGFSDNFVKPDSPAQAGKFV